MSGLQIDGLPVDFYQQFWNVIGMDLYEVFLSCFKEKSLPLSCRRAVLSFYQKKGIYVYKKTGDQCPYYVWTIR